MNIVLTGPMGSGKTTVGLRAAEALGREFIDTDILIQQITGRTIEELFSGTGEEHFREIEEKVISEIFKKDNLVIATGGGVVLSPENMRRLRLNGIIVLLEASPGILQERLKNMAGRPLLAVRENGSGLKKYLNERAKYYCNTDFKIDTGRMGIEEVVDRLCHIAKLPPIRICGCISGNKPEIDIQMAVENGVSMIELRLDLIPDPDVSSLVRNCAVPVIATDRKNKERLKEAILEGCDFVDIEVDSIEKPQIIKLARQKGCKVIVSFHEFNGVPDKFPDRGDADILKIAVMVNSKADLERLEELHGQEDNVIIVAMGPLGTPQRVSAPLLGSYLTYCSIGEATAPGQLDLKTLVELYREGGLR